ncbi:sensor histidine kinase [Undibacterium flavidum]|uniref:histidine kinase n=1 Tax=Undibacterium flavidum TaxID=2762297 RepID=A0ABR6YHJ8_9BURK|nr:HAMP domain-containing sensor histidine kinase [Undibacterium flavidum]MBC3875987.1 HAMP domain-containing histidine kinase [Undibacterium flavidum]
MKRFFLASYRLRIIFRGVFLLLSMATLGLALSLLQQEKQLSYNNYQANFNKTISQITATLRHPAGQLALLNPPAEQEGASLHPLLLPFSALDFDDQSKVQQAIAMSGCLVQYGNDGSLCVGIGNNPWAGGFIYVAGSFNSAALVSHPHGQVVRDEAHRIRVSVTLRGQEYQWLAPFEEERSSKANAGIRGRWVGFVESEVNKSNARPVRDFRGWAWQKALCNDVEKDGKDLNCDRNTFFSLRLPIAVLQEALFEKKRPVWPPQDLDQIHVELAVLAPESQIPLLDSKAMPTATPFSLNDLSALLLPGESLSIKKSSEKKEFIKLLGKVEQEEESWNVLTRLIRRLPVDEYDTPLESKELISTPLDNYEVLLKGDVRSVSKTLSVVATRVSWFVGAMLLALLLAWLLIEISIIRRITLLTKRAASLSKTMKGAGELDQLDVSDLRSADELGVLASGLHDLLRRVKEDVEREAIRTEQEKQMWHAVGHEIMSPLQSLMVLHQAPEDQSHRYISRMQQAIKVLYGSATPSEAFQSTILQLEEMDITQFLQHVADNAPHAGIDNVEFKGDFSNVIVKADEYSLEDVVTHVLKNANRYRPEGTPITLTLEADETSATIHIGNRGPHIAADMLDKIFEYGVSDQVDSGANGNRGQGLFVAQTYMAKMGGTISVRNIGSAINPADSGVEFLLSLPRRI